MSMTSPETTMESRLTTELAARGVAFERDVPLGPRTWYGIGGTAGVFASPSDCEQLAEVVKLGVASGAPVRVLGKGANLLVADGTIDGIVVSLDAAHFRRTQIDAGTGQVVAGGGANLEPLITATVREGLGGLEALAGIPATVGGALRMNAGGAFGEIGPLVQSVTVVEPDGAVNTLQRGGYEYSYRRSNLDGRIVAEAAFALTVSDDKPALRERLKEVMKYKKHSQPMAASSAGCTFKNPVGQSEHGAGKLIDDAGLKGLRIGGAEVSDVHANFIVVHDGATADDVLRLIEAVTERVKEDCGVELEREVVVWDGGMRNDE